MEKTVGFFRRVPPGVWGAVCLAVAVVYVFVWPHEGAPADPSSFRYISLRWLHPLAWVLIGLSFIVRGTTMPAKYRIANLLAFLALPAYALFMFALINEG